MDWYTLSDMFKKIRHSAPKTPIKIWNQFVSRDSRTHTWPCGLIFTMIFILVILIAYLLKIANISYPAFPPVICFLRVFALLSNNCSMYHFFLGSRTIVKWLVSPISRGTHVPLPLHYTYVYTDARFLFFFSWLRTSRK